MKILFLFEDSSKLRNRRLGYNLLNNECGYSGTETALLEMSHYLVENGHSVSIYGTQESYEDDGVKYIGIKDRDTIDFDVDWYSPIFFLWLEDNTYILSKLPSTTKLLIWFQSFINNDLVKTMLNTNRQVYGQSVAEYVKQEYLSLIPSDKSWVIFNGVNHTLVNKLIEISVKRGKWIFHAVYGRGCKVAIDVFNKVNKIDSNIASEFSILSYYTPDIDKITASNRIKFVGSQSKQGVCDMLGESDYFVYPLIQSTTAVHHDCCSTAVMEALAMGVIVITWDVGCTSSVYGDYVVKLTIPEKKRKGYNPQARFSNCPWLLTDEATKYLVDAIIKLDADKDRKENIRKRGIEWARKYNWQDMSAEMEYRLMTA